MTSVQLPEDLKKMAYTAANKTYNELQHSNVFTFAIVDAVLAVLRDADALVTPPGQRATTDPIEQCIAYLSTACQHELHDRCRISCKFCGSYCICLDCGHPRADTNGEIP